MKNVEVSHSADPSGNRTSCSSTVGRNHVVVIPSTQLDFHLHSNAAMAAKRRHLEEQDCTFTDDNYDDDLMTPPAVLLKQAQKRAEQLGDEVSMFAEHEVSGVNKLDSLIRCIALARIVHGQNHWMLAKTHIQLGKAYLEIEGLPKQALLHTAKAHDILLSPECHVTSCDTADEIKYQLAMAHCVAGQAFTHLGTFSKAQQQLLEAERMFDKMLSFGCTVAPVTATDDIGDGGVDGSASHYQVQMELTTALARLDLKREQYSNSKKHFVNSIDLTKSVLGPNSSQLIPLLRGKATAEANLSLYGSAVQSLEDAQEIAEHLYGSESVVMADLLLVRGRLGVAQLRSGVSSELESTEHLFSKAVLLFTTLLGGPHKKTLTSKDEYCNFLASCSEYREKAILLLKELIEDKKEALGELDAEVGYSLKLLSLLLLERGKFAKASLLLKKAKHVYSYSLGNKHKETQAVTRLLESLTCSTFRGKSSWKL